VHQLESDISALNDIFLDHQIHTLKIEDQKTFFDVLQEKAKNVFHPGGLIRTGDGKKWWIEEIESDGSLLLHNTEGDIRFASPARTDLELIPGSRLIELAENVTAPSTEYDVKKYTLRKAACEIYYNDSNTYASLKGSGIHLLPHQINAVYEIMSSLNHRWLIADEVGLGKTIETGLLIKEFSMRYRYSRILIVVPASLMLQWQNELKEKFNEEFTLLDGKSVRSAHKGGLAGWIKENTRIIVSIDYARQDGVSSILTRMVWDMVIFDEAHRLRRDKQTSTRAYRFAEAVSVRTKSLFLLSATPFSGKLEELYFFISLLERNKIGSLQSFMNGYYNEGGEFLNRIIRSVTIRRTKRDVGGFTKRSAYTIKYSLTSEEKQLYENISAYIQGEYRKAVEENKNARALMLCFLQKMADSSFPAVLNTVKNRIQRITQMLDEKNAAVSMPAEITEIKEDVHDMRDDADEDEDAEGLDEIRMTILELRTELTVLERLLAQGAAMQKNSKAEKLLQLVKSIKSKDQSEKIIIFTQFKTTMLHLRSVLSDYDCVIFHGGLNRAEKDSAVIQFRDRSSIFISTEAGGEGRNLQFARIMINYDLPWNPFRLEQRIGRIHRFGQKFDVVIYNFAMEESIGERLLEILTDKIKIFEDAFGELEPLLGLIGSSSSFFDGLMMHMALNPKEAEEKLLLKLNQSEGKLRKLAVSNHYLTKTNLSSAAIKKEISRMSETLKKFFLLYAQDHPEDYTITGENNIENIVYYEIDCKRKKLAGNIVSFDYSGTAVLNERGICAEYIHAEHPLIKHMLRTTLEQNINASVIMFPGSHSEAVFNFIITLNYFRSDQCYRSVRLPLDGKISSLYKKAVDEVEKIITSLKENILETNRHLVEDEIDKIRLNYKNQIIEAEEILGTYTMRNKQAGEDRYFLLIPKVKKHLERLKREEKEILQITRDKLTITSGFYLHGIELHVEGARR